MNQKLLALIGHVVLCGLTLYLATDLVSIGLFDLFFWSGIVIGLWGALGTPREWQFSSILAALQPVVQCIVLVAMIVSAQHEAAAEAARTGAPASRSNGAEFFIMADMFKSFVVVLLTIGLARWIAKRTATR